ncbi:ATP-binding protein DrrA1-3 family domain-containing protein [Paenibacillus pini]|uniref:ATP-binding protein DrrA1-3 family domain-containing protein n=1 Tax=Paenibacillus pini TaxID=669461 RepID=UPI001F57D003|nr:DUF4162 domain-containing protein [Paenibacillus pini]
MSRSCLFWTSRYRRWTAGRRDVLNLLQDIRKNTTVLFSTHVLHDAEEICDDIILIRDGHIAMQGGLDDIRRSYSEPIITIRPERSEGSQAWMDSLIHKEYVTDVQQGRDEIKLTVSNMDQAQVGLLEDALLHHVKLRTFEAGSSTLEDLYLKVVQEA